LPRFARNDGNYELIRGSPGKDKTSGWQKELIKANLRMRRFLFAPGWQ